MSIPFRQAPFKTANGTTARSLDAWFSDVINVAEFASLHTPGGAAGFSTGTGNDAPCFQAAFDVAFGSTSAPNGYTNRHLNRPVFIPAGRYRTTDTLNLTKVVGGHIYGAGKHSVRIDYEGFVAVGPNPLIPILNMNGCSDLCIEKFSMSQHGSGGVFPGTNTCVINLDWDGNNSGNGCDGNHGNHFQEMNLGGGEYGVIIGSDATSQGHGMFFLNCEIGGNPNGAYGIDMRGPNSDAMAIGGGVVYYAGAGVRCPAGGGSFYSQGLAQTGSEVDFLMESGKMMHIGELRSESPRLLRMQNGIVTVHAAIGTNGMVEAIEINGGICDVQGCSFNDSGQIFGTGGQLYLWATNFGFSVTPLSGYSGTVVWNPGGIT